MPEPRISEWGGAVGLASGPSCESSIPDVSVLPSCVIFGHFHGPGELACAQRGVVALNAYARGGGNSEREDSADKGTFAGRARSGTITFCVRLRASVVLNKAVVLHSADLSELLLARRGIFTPNAYAMGGANVKREQSATKSTPSGHTSDSAVAFRGGTGKPELNPCVPSGIMHRNGGGDVQNVVASANVHAHVSRNHCGFVCTSKSHGKAVCVRSRVRVPAAE